ncbi:hypothetical protein Ddc_24573 [Ditylenchus destructor]|nr:hypothetical protein Ddc_24573 [Ditylenchus destructor]
MAAHYIQNGREVKAEALSNLPSAQFRRKFKCAFDEREGMLPAERNGLINQLIDQPIAHLRAMSVSEPDLIRAAQTFAVFNVSGLLCN